MRRKRNTIVGWKFSGRGARVRISGGPSVWTAYLQEEERVMCRLHPRTMVDFRHLMRQIAGMNGRPISNCWALLSVYLLSMYVLHLPNM